MRPHAAFVRGMCGHVLTPFGWTAQLESHRAPVLLTFFFVSAYHSQSRCAPAGKKGVLLCARTLRLSGACVGMY